MTVERRLEAQEMPADGPGNWIVGGKCIGLFPPSIVTLDIDVSESEMRY